VNYTGANPATKAIAVIPARYKSTRLPGKPLLPILGRPLVLWVVDRALAARNVARAIVATDDRRILEAVTSAGFEAMITRSDHASGTDRVAEVAQSLPDAEIIVNVQGDEPLISPQTNDRAIEALTETDTGKVEIATTCEPISDRADIINPAVVKVVTDKNGRALYFSRAPIPYPHEAVRRHGRLEAALENEEELLSCFRKHTGLYVYRRDVLLAFAKWPQSELERFESLEQLRALEHGVKIKAIKASTSSIGVDTIEDLERVRSIFEKEACSVSKRLAV